MAIPKFDEKYITEAIKYIDENGVPFHNTSTKYDLVLDNGNTYPPKYIIAVANHLCNGSEIDVSTFNAVEAKSYFENRGYTIQTKQTKYELTITADDIVSTDEAFTMDNLSLGDNYKPLDAYFEGANGEIIKRNRARSENKISNQTLPRIAFQIYKKQIISLSSDEKKNFPICRYTAESELVCGIFSSIEEYKQYKNSYEYLRYKYAEDKLFVIYCWNIFSTIYFVQECLKRFGNPGDSFKLIYREKETVENDDSPAETDDDITPANGYRNPYSEILLNSKNIIFRGAPGTGKTYLAREIATDIVSNGYYDDYKLLSDEQKRQMEFVQFHPSYDYSDFVEGLRPIVNDDGTMGFDLQDGIFKSFVDRARKNYENSQKSKEVIEKEISVQEAMDEFFSSIEFGKDTFKTVNGTKFAITNITDKNIYISIPENANVNSLTLNLDEIKKMLESETEFTKVKDITTFFGKEFATQGYSYDYVIYKEILAKRKSSSIKTVKQEELKKYVFIIDEINRGEISKILGELFFAIDPGYRGKAGEVSTQYSNMHASPDDKFYIPDNVYIIGTMNDIDRSVDSFDFAMRRRFRFIELKADERLEILDQINDEEKKDEAIKRMTALNNEIANTEGLNENYQIGASYFLKLKTLDFDQLWTDFLRPLLQEYINGLYDENNIMKRFEKAYGYNGEMSNESN